MPLYTPFLEPFFEPDLCLNRTGACFFFSNPLILILWLWWDPLRFDLDLLIHHTVQINSVLAQLFFVFSTFLLFSPPYFTFCTPLLKTFSLCFALIVIYRFLLSLSYICILLLLIISCIFYFLVIYLFFNCLYFSVYLELDVI